MLNFNYLINNFIIRFIIFIGFRTVKLIFMVVQSNYINSKFLGERNILSTH